MRESDDDPLEKLLDSESDAEFGALVLKDHQQKLASWTAQDFSDIYVRFYPHLLRHAKRFLTNISQAEEVVQDAFLYLMTSLPEVDSEIGVLKLLKWKVRNLALDVIKANSRISFAPVDEIDLPIEHELSEHLLRADDAAIVALALAKLPPRQRQALVASLYQEKTASEISFELKLSENATRQLIFRAKSAFKRALVGEAETAGLSVSQILSVAARKAAKDSGKYVAAASALLLVFAVSIGIFPGIRSEQSVEVANQTERESIDGASPAPDTLPDEDSFSASEVLPTPATVPSQAAPEATILETAESPNFQPSLGSGFPVRAGLGSTDAGFGYAFGADRDQLIRQILIFSNDLLSAQVDLVRIPDSYTYELSNPRASFELSGREFLVTAGNYASSIIMSEDGQVLTLVANDLVLLNAQGEEFLEQPLSDSSLTVLVELDILGQVIAASVFIN